MQWLEKPSEQAAVTPKLVDKVDDGILRAKFIFTCASLQQKYLILRSFLNTEKKYQFIRIKIQSR